MLLRLEQGASRHRGGIVVRADQIRYKLLARGVLAKAVTGNGAGTGTGTGTL
jgi:hypothetical protein